MLVGASAGGLAALQALLQPLAAAFPLPVVVVQHLGQSDDARRWGALLARRCALPVREAAHGAPVARGVVHLAPAGYHLLIERSQRFALSAEDRILHVRPSIDALFESAADVYRGGCVGVILTGANEDGARGLAAIRSRGGLALVQRPDSAEAPQMPEAALALAGADHWLAPAEIGEKLNALVEPA